MSSDLPATRARYAVSSWIEAGGKIAVRECGVGRSVCREKVGGGRWSRCGCFGGRFIGTVGAPGSGDKAGMSQLCVGPSSVGT